MDIDFNVDFSPPHRTIHPSLPYHPSSSRATNPPLQEGHHQVPSSMVSLPPQASDGPSSQQYGDQEDESDLVELMETSHRSVLQQQEETEVCDVAVW